MTRDWTKRAGLFCWLLLICLYPGCKEEAVPEPFAPSRAHEAYIFGLGQAGLAGTALGKDWVDASQKALELPQEIELPFREVVYFDPVHPAAFGYLFSTHRGQVVNVHVEDQDDPELKLFIDVFRPEEGSSQPFALIASAGEQERQAQFEPRGDNQYILRVQPELLRGGSFEVSVETQPVFDFPVQGHSSRSIQSGFGAPREAGRRSHHGVDIFARRYTPVLAPSRAYVRRVGENRLGGHVIWLRDAERPLTLYFAHLQEQKVEEGTVVERGDVIGTVGNSGNARTTPTHLHFGVYKRPEGPVDPYYYLYRIGHPPPTVKVDSGLLGRWARSRNENIQLRQAPALRAATLGKLKREMPLQVVGAAGNYLKVRLPDGVTGYVSSRLLEPDPKPLLELTLEEDSELLSLPSSKAVQIGSLPAGSSVGVLGEFSDYCLIRSLPGRMGWLHQADSAAIRTVEED